MVTCSDRMDDAFKRPAAVVTQTDGRGAWPWSIHAGFMLAEHKA
jgi:hypothetical protein